MKKNALVLFFALALAPAVAFATVKSDIAKVETATQKCLDNPDNQSTYGMNMCLDAGYSAADQVLNQVYHSIVTNLKKKTGDAESDKQSAEILSRLVKAQRAWIAFRDADSTLRGIEMLGGTGESQVVIGSLYEMTKTRAADLDSILNSTN